MSLKKYAIIDTLIMIVSMIIVEVVITKLIVHALVMDINQFKFRSAATFSFSMALVLVAKTRWKWNYLIHLIPLTILMWWMADFDGQNLVIILGGNIVALLLLMVIPNKKSYKNIELIGWSLLLILGIAVGRSMTAYMFKQANFGYFITYYISLEALGMILTPLVVSFANGLHVVGDAKTYIETIQAEYKAKEGDKKNERTTKPRTAK